MCVNVTVEIMCMLFIQIIGLFIYFWVSVGIKWCSKKKIFV